MADFINSEKTIYSDRIKNDFENLYNEVIENNDILKNFSLEDISEFYKKSNIFGRKCLDAEKHNKKYTLFSYINSKEEFYKQIMTTTIISYLFRQSLNYKINLSELTEKVNDEDFLEEVTNKYLLNPKHERKLLMKEIKLEFLKNNYELDYDLDNEDEAKEFYTFEFSEKDLEEINKITDLKLKKLQQIEYKVNNVKKIDKINELINKQSEQERVIIQRFLKNIFSYNPDRHIMKSYSYEDMTETYEDYKKIVLAKVDEDMKEDLKTIEDNIPSNKFWYNLKNYYESHYDLFRLFVQNLYKVEPERDLMINIHGQFEDKEEMNKFVEFNKVNFITSPVAIENNEWKLLAKYLPNRTNGEVLGKESEIVKGLVEKYKEDSKIAEELTKKDMKKARLENMFKNNKESDKIKKYLEENNPRAGTLINSDNVITEEEYNEYENKIKNLSVQPSNEKYEAILDDDDYAIKYRIIKPDFEKKTLDEALIKM